ncbi:MAG: efflux RND transporter periplasmic adaptor subunit [Candidatus Acidiferrales bacterium]
MSLRDSYNKHKTGYIVIACVVVLIGLWIYFRARGTGPQYTTAVVGRGNITSVVQATGTINPLTTIPVGSYVSGTVKYIFADFNTRVKNGQVLAQLDPAIYEAQVTEARGNLQNAETDLITLHANVQAAQANLAKSQANLQYEVATAKRSQDLFSAGVVSTDSNEQTQSTMSQAEAGVKSSQAAVEQAKAQLAQAKTSITSMQGALDASETNLKYTTITSPIDGTVIARNIDVGQSVAATLQAPNVFSVAQDLSRMQVYAATDESDTGNIRNGIPVTFQVDAFPDDVFHGRVSNIRLNPTTVQNVVTYNTIIDFNNPNEKLLPGETAYVTIPTGHAENAVEIPNPALTFKPTMPPKALQRLYKEYKIAAQASTTHLNGWQLVWKLSAQKQLVPVAVQCGITDYNNTQLLQGNLQPGDKLVTTEQNAGASSNGTRSPFFGGRRGPR